MVVTLKRHINKNERYYRISIIKNLFNEYIVERVFGNTRYITPTGKVINIFNSQYEAIEYIKVLLKKKLNKGYKQCTNKYQRFNNAI